MQQITQIDQLYDSINIVDFMLSKALAIDELTQTAKVETMLREYISKQWDRLASEASSVALKELNKSSEIVTDKDISRIVKSIDEVMNKWYDVVSVRFHNEMINIYTLSHVAALKKAYKITKAPMDFSTGTFVAKAEKFKVRPDFDMSDYRAMSALEGHQVFWIGEHYKNNVSDTIAKVTKEHLIEHGRGRVAAGKTMKQVVESNLKHVKIPKGFRGTSERYFEGLTANAATSARVTAQLNAFSNVGFTTFQVVNPNDHRTCEKCQMLDGKEFTVSDAGIQLENLLSATTPEQVKQAQPFITTKMAHNLTGGRIGRVSPKGTRGLVKANVIMPPYHFRCRCNIDVVSKEMGIRAPKPIRTKPVLPKPKPKPRTTATINPHDDLVGDFKVISEQWDSLYGTKELGKIRKTINKTFEKHFGMTQTPARERGSLLPEELTKGQNKKLYIRTNKKSLGTHYWTGRIELKRSSAETISDELKQILDGTWKNTFLHKQDLGIETLIHEVVHGSNRSSMKAFKDSARSLIEGTTEIVSKSILRKLLGVNNAYGKSQEFVLHRNTFIQPFKLRTKFYDRWIAPGAYDRQIIDILESVERVVGKNWTEQQIIDAVETASFAINRPGVKISTEVEDVIYDFVDNIPNITKDEKALLVRDIATNITRLP